MKKSISSLYNPRKLMIQLGGRTYMIPIDFGIPRNPVRLIKMNLTETYSRVRVGRNVSDRFPIRNDLKKGDALSPILFNFALEYTIRRGQVNQDGLKLNDSHQLLA
jgi:hypothetical protein